MRILVSEDTDANLCKILRDKRPGCMDVVLIDKYREIYA